VFGTAKEDMRLPGSMGDTKEERLPQEDSKIKLIHRLYLFLVSFVVLLTQPLLSLSGGILRNVLGLDLRPDVVVDFLGDVKLYQQDERVGREFLIDLGKHPPRTSIRRRLIKALVQMSLKDYDRWYLLSHSLGTLVAFNGLMETENALPHYLNQSLWKRWCRKFPNHRKTNEPLTDEEQKKMLPKRPNWLDPDDVIDRGQLFSKLKGFMTYGSPLSKFAVLWPAIVLINRDESVFREDFEWINVFDPTDPVSDFTRFFDGQTKDSRLTPREVVYKAEQLHLLSHVQYFTFNPKRKNPLVKQVAQWLISGDKFNVPSPQNQWGWPQPKVDGKDSFVVWLYFNLGVLIWVLFGAVMSIALSVLVPPVLPDKLLDIRLPEAIVSKLLPWEASINSFLSTANTLLSKPLSYVVLAGVAVFGVGIIASLLGGNNNKPTLQKDQQLS
jgi:hypothetical protein